MQPNSTTISFPNMDDGFTKADAISIVPRKSGHFSSFGVDIAFASTATGAIVSGKRISEKKYDVDIVVAFQISGSQAAIKPKISFIDKCTYQIQSTYTGKPIIFGQNKLLEMVNQENGKVFFIQLPDADKDGNPFNFNKEYKVLQTTHRFFNSFNYIFSPINKSSPTDKDLNELIAKMDRRI